MNKKIPIICALFFVFVILSSSVLALNSPIIVDSGIINDRIKSNETAKFLLFVENVKSQSDAIKIHHDFLKWQVDPEPYLLRIDPGETEVSEIKISPPSNIAPGAYSLTLKLYSENYPEIVRKHTLVLTVTENVNKESIYIESNIPNSSYPGEMNASFEVSNIKAYDLENVNIEIDSEIFSEKHAYTFDDLEEDEVEVIEDTFDLLSKSPGDYSIVLNGYVNEELVYTNEKILTLKEKGGISLTKETEDGFLSKTYTINIVNNGNLEANKELKANFGGFERLFVSSNPEPSAKVDAESGEDWFWIYSLDSGESTVIKYTINYQPLFYIGLILAIILIFAYWYFNNEVIVSKKIMLTKTKDNKKYIKIMLQLKNNTNKGLHNVKLVDWVKHPLDLTEQFDTLHPSIIKKKEDRIKIKWNISTLAPKEEKVVSYGTKAKMGILGEMNLPKAAVVVKIRNKMKEFWSNSPIIKGKE